MSQTPSKHPAGGAALLAVLAVTITSILWGTTGTVAAYAPDLSSLAVGAAALGLAGLLLALVTLPRIKSERLIRESVGQHEHY